MMTIAVKLQTLLVLQMEQKFDHFCKTFAIPRSLARFARAVWLLDHGNLQVCLCSQL